MACEDRFIEIYGTFYARVGLARVFVILPREIHILSHLKSPCVRCGEADFIVYSFQIEASEDVDDEMDELLQDFEEKTKRTVMHSIHFY